MRRKNAERTRKAGNESRDDGHGEEEERRAAKNTEKKGMNELISNTHGICWKSMEMSVPTVRPPQARRFCGPR
jgi:hypothetical protein